MESLNNLQLKFISKIIREFTHEIKNHLAFIKESSGLVGDILDNKEILDEKKFHQIKQIIKSIETQIDKSANQFNYLNRFAHRMDKEICEFDVNEVLEELVSLMNRFISRKNIQLKKDFHSQLPKVNSSPLLIQLLVFCFLFEAAERLEVNSIFEISSLLSNSNSSIIVKLGCNKLDLETINLKNCEQDLVAKVTELLHIDIRKHVDFLELIIPLSIK